MIEPSMLLLWLFLGTLTGWLAGRFLFGSRLSDDLVGGALGAIIGGVLASVLFRDMTGGILGTLAFSIAIAVVLVVALRIIPNHRLMS